MKITCTVTGASLGAAAGDRVGLCCRGRRRLARKSHDRGRRNLAARLYFGRGVPVQHSRLVLEAPSSLPLHYTQELLPDLKPQRTEVGDRVRVTFDYGAMEPLDDADKNLPSDVAPYPEVAFSTGRSWSQLADEYGKVVDARIAASDVKALVAKLIASKQSRDDKVRAILQYLATEVRYTGVEFGDAAVVPHFPTEVLAHKYGDCKDKSVLLIAMLRSAGVSAYVALLDAGERQDVVPDLPGMGLFDHAIVYVPGVPDFWVDATDEYARLGQLPASDQGRYASRDPPGQRLPRAYGGDFFKGQRPD